jgi:hypothetical protein
MLFRRSKKEELIKLLKNSGSDFNFDPNSVKFRLLNSISEVGQKKPVRHFRFHRVLTYSVGFTGLVIAISTTFAFASTSKPGDTLFGLNKFGENVVMKLPLSVEQKAKVQEYIVTNRLEALDQVKTKEEQPTAKTKAKKLKTIKETDESFVSAIDNITKNKKKLEASGKIKDAEKLEKVLEQLDAQAEKSEKRIRELEDNSDDKEVKAEIRRHLLKIQESRKKAQSEIKRFNSPDTSPSR